MATTPVKKKEAMDSLLERFEDIIDRGAEKMDSGKLQESEKNFHEAIDRAAANKRRRETA